MAFGVVERPPGDYCDVTDHPIVLGQVAADPPLGSVQRHLTWAILPQLFQILGDQHRRDLPFTTPSTMPRPLARVLFVRFVSRLATSCRVCDCRPMPEPLCA